MPLTHVLAALPDTDFIFSLIIAGARKGHFSTQFSSDKAALRRHLGAVIGYGRQGENQVHSQAMVTWLDDKRIGVTIVTATEKSDNSIEIGAIAIKREFQGMGYGAILLDALLARLLPHGAIYVRCFPSSEKLFQMLIRRGFAVIAQTEKGTRILKHAREQPPEHGMGESVIRGMAV